MSKCINKLERSSQELIELNVGGVHYTTTLKTLLRPTGSLFETLFTDCNSRQAMIKDNNGKYFIDRDGLLFRFILDYMRDLKVALPDIFSESAQLINEAEFFMLTDMVRILSAQRNTTAVSFLSETDTTCVSSKQTARGLPLSSGMNQLKSSTTNSGYITLGYRGTFAFGRDGLADVKFRKLSRITVCGRVSLCQEVFKDTLNDSRDPDRGETTRYTARYFLKHLFLEQAFDMLQKAGFILVGVCGSGTNSAGEVKAGLDTEEEKWQHYNEFVFEGR